VHDSGWWKGRRAVFRHGELHTSAEDGRRFPSNYTEPFHAARGAPSLPRRVTALPEIKLEGEELGQAAFDVGQAAGAAGGEVDVGAISDPILRAIAQREAEKKAKGEAPTAHALVQVRLLRTLAGSLAFSLACSCP